MLSSAYNQRHSSKSPSYTVTMLSHRHAKAISILIETVRASLPEDTRHFLKPRSHGNVSAHFAAFNPGFGIFNASGQLIGCALLAPLSDGDDANNALNYPKEHLLAGHWALQSVARHPDYAGHGLMGLLLEAAKKHALENPQVEFVIAKVNVNNTPSQHGFLNAGFAPAAQGQDHMSGDPVVYLGLHTGSGLAPTGGNPVQLGHDDHSPAPFR